MHSKNPLVFRVDLRGLSIPLHEAGGGPDLSGPHFFWQVGLPASQQEQGLHSRRRVYPDERGVEGCAEEDGQGGDVEVEEQDDDGAYGAVGLVVGIEAAPQVHVEGDAGKNPQQDAHDAAGCDPAERLVGVRGEVEEEGYRHDHEQERRGPAHYVPDEHELVAESKYLGERPTDGRACYQEQYSYQHEGREAQSHDYGDAPDLPERPRLLHVVGAVEGVYERRESPRGSPDRTEDADR